jgi:hypothetical protein
MGARMSRVSSSGQFQLFTPTTATVEGRTLRAMTITCRCGCRDTVTMNRIATGRGFDVDNENNMIARKFERRGWVIGHNANTHKCPLCRTRADIKMVKEEPVNVTPINPKPPLPPEELQRRQRRRIDVQLSECYDDKTSRYIDDWTDKKVAEALGVPQALVADVREYSYGPHASNEVIDNTMAQGRELVSELREIAKKALDQAGAIEKRMIDIQHAVHP